MNPPRTSLSTALSTSLSTSLSTLLSDPDAVGAESRRDGRQRVIVDDGIALMSVVGTLSALEFLKSHAVDGRVIARVLLDPARRRRPPALAAA